MNQETLKTILPHRDAMLLLDEAKVEAGFACGKKYITGDEWFLRGHFPNAPIVPGVILCEILAQSVCVLLDGKIPAGTLPVFTGLNKVKFKHPVKPGDTFCTKCEITREFGGMYFAKGTGSVGENLCVSAEFSFAITDKVG